MKRTSVIEFEKYLLGLIGLRCWAVTAGAGTGSHVEIAFGQKLKRSRPLRNESLDDVSRNYTGEWSLFVENCAWRLGSGSEMLCSSKSDNTEGGEMLLGLQRLIGLRVIAPRLNVAGNDLRVEFEMGLNLVMFADSPNESEGDNFSVFGPGYVWTVGPRGLLTAEAR